jgi:peptidyl-prolyl cis-trans isomerase D
MLGPLRKFSSSIYAKILLGIIVIPFVFWGMGSSFIGGNKNIIVVIEKEKYSVEELENFLNGPNILIKFI